MPSEKISKIGTKFIKICYIILVFFTPFLFTPWNTELFEFNKMIFVYLITIFILFAWIVKMIAEKRIIYTKTFFEFPLIFFYMALSISTLFSKDIYMSVFGYYSRFNQGLLSLSAYLILYFAFVSNVKSESQTQTKNYLNALLGAIILSGIIVSTYGICQHFGLDAFRWVQDVKTRVFSSLGQPNWLGAYLAIMIMIAYGVYLSFLNNLSADSNNVKFKSQNEKSQFKIKNYPNNLEIKQLNNNFFHLLKAYILPLTVIAILYTALLFTRSRSAFPAFHLCFGIFTIIFFKRFQKIFITFYLIFFLLINISNILPTPIEKFNQLTIPNIISKIDIKNSSVASQKKGASPSPIRQLADGEGGTESFAIRQIVWKGAWNTFLNNPVVGYGNETFALAYYKYKPKEQNLLSEWDFLYNKAHNEYLNYLATTGIIGVGAYLIFIFSVAFYALKICKKTHISISLFLAWTTILITNALGFSVVIISLFFYLIPAILIVLNQTPKSEKTASNLSRQQTDITIKQSSLFVILLIAAYSMLRILISWWFADINFAKAKISEEKGDYNNAYQEYKNAINLSSFHPNYHGEFALFLSELPNYFSKQQDEKIIQEVAFQAIQESEIATAISPNNPIFYNYQALVFHNLSFINKKYSKMAISSIMKAKKLSPNDPKITYYAAIYYLTGGESNKSLNYFYEAIALKPNYIEPNVNLAKLLYENGKKSHALKLVKNLLKYYPNNENIEKLINEYNN